MTAKRCAVRLTYMRTRPFARSSLPTYRQFSSAVAVHEFLHKPSFTRKSATVEAKPVTWPTATTIPKRWISSDSNDQTNKIYTFEHILNIIQKQDKSSSSSSTSSPPRILLIDVREPHEFEANSIPTAINIPVTSQPDALLLDEEDFQNRFGFAKPSLDQEVVFFCKAGVRSRASAGIAKEAGYTNVAEYPGSWLDWERRGGPGTK